MPTRNDDWRPDLEGRFWLELRRPGCTPVRKGSWPLAMMKATLREFMAANPDAFISVVTIGADGPMFQDALEALSVMDRRSWSSSRRHIETTGRAFAEHHVTRQGRRFVADRQGADTAARRYLSLILERRHGPAHLAGMIQTVDRQHLGQMMAAFEEFGIHGEWDRVVDAIPPMTRTASAA